MSRSLSYKIWKHLNKKYGKTCYAEVQNSNQYIQILQKEFDALKLFITSSLINLENFNVNPIFNKQLFNIFNEKWLIAAQEHTFDNLMWRQTQLSFHELWQLFYQHGLISHDKWGFFSKQIRFLLLHGDLLSNMKDIFDEHINNINSWTAQTILRYLSYLILNNDKDNAFNILNFYVKKFGNRDLHTFLPVAAFAANHGVSDKNINRSSDYWNKIKEHADLFTQMIKGKRVALVGNGPQEIGTRNGSKIDTYDVVIRMNKYEINSTTINDYGKKVTIWVNCEKIPQDIEKKGDFKAFFWLCYFYADPMFDFISNQTSLYAKCPIGQLDMVSLWREVYHETGIYCPSNGLNLIYLIKKINPYFSAKDCFGFSFKDSDLNENHQWVHYSGETLFNMPHDLYKEKEAILKILGK